LTFASKPKQDNKRHPSSKTNDTDQRLYHVTPVSEPENEVELNDDDKRLIEESANMYNTRHSSEQCNKDESQHGDTQAYEDGHVSQPGTTYSYATRIGAPVLTLGTAVAVGAYYYYNNDVALSHWNTISRTGSNVFTQVGQYMLSLQTVSNAYDYVSQALGLTSVESVEYPAGFDPESHMYQAEHDHTGVLDKVTEVLPSFDRLKHTVTESIPAALSTKQDNCNA